jgi:hypothetical protein
MPSCAQAAGSGQPSSSMSIKNIVENLQDIVENSEDAITVPHPGSLMYARSSKSQVDRRECVALSIP